MWKLVKTELSYLRLWIVVGLVLLLGIAIAFRFQMSNSIWIQDTYSTLFWCSYIVNMIIQIVLMYSENFESRIRGIAMLPVSNNALGLARLMTPLVICLLLLGFWILSSCILIIGTDHSLPKVVGSNNIYSIDILQPYHYIGLWFGSLFLIRLLSEPYGRVAVLSYWVLLILLLFQLISNSVTQNIDLFIFWMTIPFSGYGAIGFALLVFWFFKLRRSYLR